MTYASLKTIKAKEQFIREQLKTNDNWVMRGLIAVWNKQTEDEKQVKDTVHHNGVGFNGRDAQFLSSLAERANRDGSLSFNQMKAARKCMLKYAGQLRRIADGLYDARGLQGAQEGA